MQFTIYPYYESQYYASWVFDDERTGLVQEALIKGINTMIDIMTVDIPNAREGFKLIFSDEPFEGYQTQLDWLREGEAYEQGNWYWSESMKMEGWLCPSLLLYFPTAPQHLYVAAMKKIELTHCD